MTDREAIDVLFNEWKCIDRNDGIHCDRKCESCDLVMDVGIIREAFNMAISALQAQDSPKPTAGSVQNVQNEDLILRKAAIDSLGERPMVWTDDDQYALGERNQYDMDRLAIETLPSAQPMPQWIPVSEKLPEEDKDVLVTVYFAGLTQKHKTGWNDHIKPSTYVDIASYYGGDWVSASDEYKVARSRHRVIAWMPLPKEYSGE